MVQWAQVKIASLVPGDGGGPAHFVGLKQEELQLRADVKGVEAHVLRPAQHPAQDTPGVAHKGGAVRVIHIADEPGHLALGGPPGENRKTIQIGIQALVRLVDAGEPLDGGAVEHDLVVHRLLDLRGGDGHVFQLAKNIHKLHADKLDLLVLYQTDDVFLGVTHAERSFSPPGGRGLLTLIKAVCFPSLTCVSSIAVLTDAFHSFYHRSRQKTRGFRS